MTPKTRLDRLAKRLAPRPPAAGLPNVFHLPVAPDEPTDMTVV